MFSDKIYKHFFSELSKHFVIVLFALTAVVWAVQSVNFLDLIVEDGHSVALYLKYSFLNVIKIITKFIPLSFLIALIITIEKFDSDNELMALWTAGLNKMKVVNFFLKISILVTLLQLLLGILINPYILSHSRSLIKSSDINFVSSTIKTNRFNDTVPGLTIFAEGKNENNVFKNIFIRDEGKIFKGLDSDENASLLTIFAKKAKLFDLDKSILVLENGTIHSESEEGKIRAIDFKRTKLNLSGMQTKSITQAKVQETKSQTLIKCHLDHDIIAVGKHFPGQGSSQGDTHQDWVDVSDTWSDLELRPYNKLIQAKSRPIIIITSNNEKELPEAFLRRCFFHYIKFPEADTMEEIVNVHFPEIKQNLIKEAFKIFYDIRDVPGIKKKPSTSELIDWLKLLMTDDIDAKTLKESDPKKLIPPLHGALLKNEQDVHLFERLAFISRRESENIE